MSAPEEPLECLDAGPDPSGCDGPIELRYPMSPTGRWFPRCEKHYEQRLEIQRGIDERYPTHAPSDWSPLDAGEAWGEDDY